MRRLEVCIDSVRSAEAAQLGGAARVELCSNLLQGGVTPSAGLISLVRQRLQIGLQVLIRPRAGDFCYSPAEQEVIRRDILTAKQLGADGVVLGQLQPDGNIDCAALQPLVDLARPLQLTFHRAFDLCSDPNRALEEIIGLGFDYLLTSGQQPTAIAGSELIASLIRQAAGRIAIMPGGGVTEDNIRQLAEATGAQQFHSSGRRAEDSHMRFRRPGLSMGAWAGDEYSAAWVAIDRVSAMVKALS